MHGTTLGGTHRHSERLGSENVGTDRPSRGRVPDATRLDADRDARSDRGLPPVAGRRQGNDVAGLRPLLVFVRTRPTATMTRTVRTISILAALGGAACTGPTMHVVWDRQAVPTALLAASAEACTHAQVNGIPRGDTFTYHGGASTDPVVSIDFQFENRFDNDRNLHVRTVYIDANGRAIAEGEGQATIQDGATITLIMSPTGPQ